MNMKGRTILRVLDLMVLAMPVAAMDGCPNQIHAGRVTSATFGPIYPSEMAAGATFSSSDATLKGIFDHAEACESTNTKEFLPGLDNVVEGAGYKNVWLETQPMAGAMWAVRNLTQGLANQLIFMRTQRDDGRLPGMVTTDGNGNLSSVYCLGSNPTDGGESLLQGQYFSQPAVDVAFFLNLSSTPTAKFDTIAYLKELHVVLERFDGWMWRARSGQKPYSDVLWVPGSSDWGGDGFDGYNGYTAPFFSQDMMSYAHSNAAALRRTSLLLGNASGVQYWSAKMETVAATLKRALWDSGRGACYDIDVTGKPVDVLMHNNLRCMWHGTFDLKMADTFVARHLRNTSEFWTPFPLPSIAANDPKFQPGLPRNSWSGPSEGLTYQRAVRALQNYGYHVEVSLLGQLLLKAIGKSMTFPQQWNPAPYNDPTKGPLAPGTAGPGDCYGPALLSALEYLGLMYGIVVLPGEGLLQWSAVTITNGSTGINSTLTSTTTSSNGIWSDFLSDHVGNFSQTLGDNIFAMAIGESSFSGARNSKPLFEATRGVRILSSVTGAGDVTGVIGISPQPVALNLTIHSTSIHSHSVSADANSTGGNMVVTGTVEPNTEYLIVDGMLKMKRQVPFTPLRQSRSL